MKKSLLPLFAILLIGCGGDSGSIAPEPEPVIISPLDVTVDKTLIGTFNILVDDSSLYNKKTSCYGSYFDQEVELWSENNKYYVVADEKILIESFTSFEEHPSFTKEGIANCTVVNVVSYNIDPRTSLPTLNSGKDDSILLTQAQVDCTYNKNDYYCYISSNTQICFPETTKTCTLWYQAEISK